MFNEITQGNLKEEFNSLSEVTSAFFTLSRVHGKKLGLGLGLAHDLKSNISNFRLQANRAEGNLKEESKSLLEVTSPQHPLFYGSILT